jgi:ureidoglycolate lyase
MARSTGSSVLSVTAKPADPAAFAAFGAFLAPPPVAGDRIQLGGWLEPVPGRALSCHMNRVPPADPSPRVEQVERHPHAAQLFIPVGVTRYLVLVMPSDGTGAPDPAGARAFVVPGTIGVVYRPGTWHAGISALDEGGSFFVAMWRGGDDDVFASVPAIDIEVPGWAAAEGKVRARGAEGTDDG